jgi:hypothetical protein
MAQSGLEAAPLRCGRWARLGRQCDGWTSEWATAIDKAQKTKAAEKKYDGECNNIGVFERLTQNSIHADKERLRAPLPARLAKSIEYVLS